MTSTLVASPEIVGNIGSCTTNISRVTENRTFWIENIKEIATNSCDGSIQYFHHWEFTGIACLLLAVGVVIGVLFLMALSDGI